jgi:hypothetical protein
MCFEIRRVARQLANAALKRATILKSPVAPTKTPTNAPYKSTHQNAHTGSRRLKRSCPASNHGTSRSSHAAPSSKPHGCPCVSTSGDASVRSAQGMWKSALAVFLTLLFRRRSC